MIKASLDIGSQSILLLIADIQANRVSPVHEEFYAPRLGEGVSETGLLGKPAMQRAESALWDALERCHRLGATEIIAGGTAALRQADNSHEFVAGIRSRLGIDIKILSANDEAVLTYLGALSGLNVAGRVAVLDVGGGSTECITGFVERPKATMSVPIGAVNLAGRFGRSPGQNPKAIAELQKTLGSMAAEARGNVVVGVGGSVTTLAALKLKLKKYNPQKITGSVLTLSDLGKMLFQFRSLPISRIKDLPGMDPSRADIIEAGATIIRTFLVLAEADSIFVSARGLRYGLLLGASSNKNGL